MTRWRRVFLRGFSRLAGALDWQRKVRVKMLFMVFLMAVLPFTVFAVIIFRMGASYVLLDAARETQSEVQRLAISLDVFFTSRFERLRQHHELIAQVGTAVQKRPGDFLDSIFLEYPSIAAAGFINTDGNIHEFRVRDPEQLSSLRSVAATAAQPRLFLNYALGEVTFSPSLSEPVFPVWISSPIPGMPDQYRSLVVIFGLATLWQQLPFVWRDEPLEVVFQLQSMSWTLAPRSTPPVHAGHPGRLFFYFEDTMEGIVSPVLPMTDDRGVEILSSSTACPTLPWRLRLDRTTQPFHRQSLQFKIFIVLFWILSLAFALTGGVVFVSKLVRPIEDLESGIRLVSSGLMGDELPIRSHDEIGRLTRTFNQMTRTLVQRNEEIRQKTRELTFFNTITRIINQSVDLSTFLDNSLQKILQLMRAGLGVVYVYQPVLNQLKAISHFGLSEKFTGSALQAEIIRTVVEPVYRSGEPQMIRDISRRANLRDLAQTERIRELLLVPLQAQGRAVGVLAVGSRRKHSFHYRDLTLLGSLGDEIGVAVENTTLYAELQLKIKQLEEANLELQEMDRFKSRFLSNVSHELKTPLTSIVTYVDLFLHDKIGPLDPLQREKLDIVRRNVNNLLALINDLLTLTKMEDHREAGLRMEPVILQEIVDHVIMDTLEIARGKGLTLVRSGLETPIMVLVDRQRIRQVLQNLISNALKFTEQGGVDIILTDRRRSDTAGIHCEEVEVTVRDTGIGIPAEELPKIFQRFYQVDSSSTRKYIGSGLGLSIVKETLAAHHAQIEVESQDGHGTTFRFALPIINPTKRPQG